MKLNISVLGQRDPRWASLKLGTSSVTIGGYGCVITSMAMLCSYYGKNTNPAIINEDIKRVNGYSSGNLFIWQSISQIYSDIKNTAIKDYPLNPTPIDSIKSQLDSGRPVVVWLDLNPSQPGPDHFGLIVGYENNDFWLNDPWYGDQVLLNTRYGDPVKNIFGHRFFMGSIPTQTPTTDDLLKQRADASVAVAERLNKPVDKDIILADIKMLLEQEQIIVEKDRIIQTREEELEKIKQNAKTMSDKVETLSKENERLSTSLQELTEDAKEQSDEIKELQRRLEEVKDYHLIETATVTDLINEIVKRLFKRRG